MADHLTMGCSCSLSLSVAVLVLVAFCGIPRADGSMKNNVEWDKNITCYVCNVREDPGCYSSRPEVLRKYLRTCNMRSQCTVILAAGLGYWFMNQGGHYMERSYISMEYDTQTTFSLSESFSFNYEHKYSTRACITDRCNTFQPDNITLSNIADLATNLEKFKKIEMAEIAALTTLAPNEPIPDRTTTVVPPPAPPPRKPTPDVNINKEPLKNPSPGSGGSIAGDGVCC